MLTAPPPHSHTPRLVLDDTTAVEGVTVTMKLPESIRALASDPLARFVLTNTDAAVSAKAGAAATSGTACKGPTSYDTASGTLSASGCAAGTYSVRVVKSAEGTSGKVSQPDMTCMETAAQPGFLGHCHVVIN